jgi:signal transduction histidine kinase
MEAILTHLIRDHGCRRLAFIGGPQRDPDAQARSAVYRQVLAEHDLSFDSRLVATGHFTIASGTAAAAEILDRGVEFDALVAANDGMALGAITALKARGIRVPRDVRVTGFDDLVMARFSAPPLTTARQPFERMVALAVGSVVDQIAGRQVADCTRLAVELVPRNSCGCGLRTAASEPCRPSGTWQPPAEFLRDNAERLRRRLGTLLSLPDATGSRSAHRLIDALQAELEGEQDAFVMELEVLLDGMADNSVVFEELQTAITLLRDEFNAAGATHLEPLWHSARCSIASSNTRTQAQQQLSIEMTYLQLLACGERFSTALDLGALKRTLAEELPTLQIRDAVVALHADERQHQLEPLLWMRDGRPQNPPASRLPATQLLARGAYCVDRRRTAFVLPLTFETEYLGVVVFEPGSGIAVYDMLREQISMAVKNLALREEIARRTALHERSVQERFATTERMKSLSVLAGGVAHDLNSALGPLVALPDLMLSELEQLSAAPRRDDGRLRSHVEAIRSAGARATQTIKDLMTLGRQGQTQKAPLDLNRTVASCLTAEPMLFVGQDQREVEVALELHPEPLVVNASQHHVERAVSNLLRNAAEAVDGAGKITVGTSLASLSAPLAGYETVAPGQYAVVTVSDTGRGIEPDAIGRVFEPFFTKKELRDHSGSGLGLSIVHGVVKEHDGFVDVVSTAGKGTTFTLYFPLAAESRSVADGPQPG